MHRLGFDLLGGFVLPAPDPEAEDPGPPLESLIPQKIKDLDGKLVSIEGYMLPLEEARRAHELLEAGEVFGKLLLKP